MAANAIDGVIEDRFRSIISAYNSTITKFLSRYMISSQFLSGVTNNPTLIRCDFSTINQFYEIMTSAHQTLLQHPKSIFLWEYNRLCQIFWTTKYSKLPNSNDFFNNGQISYSKISHKKSSGIFDFNLYDSLTQSDSDEFILNYIEQISSNSIQISIFNSTSDFDSASSSTVTFGSNIDINAQYQNIETSSYTTHISSDQQVDLIAISPNLDNPNGNTTSLIGISIPIQFLDDELKLLSKEFQCKYVFMNLNDEIIIDDENSSIDNWSKLRTIQSSSGFWSHLNQTTANYSENIVKLEIHNTIYKIKEISIYFKNNKLFKIIIAFPVYDSERKYIFQESIIFIMCLVLLCLMCVIVLILLRMNTNRKLRKLAKIAPKEIKFRNLGMIPQYGGIGTGIQKLRNLQLRFPEKEVFNKKMDNVISNLAEQKKKLFSAELIQKNNDDEFCHYLIETKPAFSTQSSTQNENSIHDNSIHDNSYSLWKKLHASKIQQLEHLGSLSFDWNKYTSSPAKELMRLMISIISSENLIFKEFDPDSLIQFMQQITTKCCKDNVRTAHELVSLNYLLNTFFKNWIPRRIDRFILYMATFLYNTDSSIAFNLIDDSEDFSQATEKVWFSSSSSTTNLVDDSVDNLPNHDESSIYSVEYEDHHKDEIIHDDVELQISDEEQETYKLKLKMRAFQDHNSVISRNTDFILHMLAYFIPTPIEKAPLIEYFKETLTEIMIDVQDSKQFELLGEFSCRIESQYFSVMSDQNDRILFMKALIMLCHFCPYWSNVETMLKATERLNHSIFGTNDNENIPEFHYEHSSKIVAPWVSIFMNFSPLDQIVNNLQANINYWKNKMS